MVTVVVHDDERNVPFSLGVIDVVYGKRFSLGLVCLVNLFS